MIKICTVCQEPKEKYRYRKRSDGKGYKYIDQYGSWWDAGKCPDCNKKWHTAYSRKKGIRPIDECKFPPMIKSRQTHRDAADYLKKNGFTDVIINPLPNGPDITATFNKKPLLIEVKMICESRNSYFVCAVQEKRKTDDLIIMVSQDGDKIFMETMKKHLKKCSPKGTRPVSDLVKNKPMRKRKT